MTNDYKGGLTVEPQAAGAKRLFRFSMHSLLWLMVVAALSLTCFIQYRKLRQTEAALSRTAWAGSETFIPSGKFRLLVNRIIDDHEIKMIVIRFETNDQKYLTVDGASSITALSIDGQTYWAETQILSSYDSSHRRMTTLTRVKSGAGWAGDKWSTHYRQPLIPKSL